MRYVRFDKEIEQFVTEYYLEEITYTIWLPTHLSPT